MPTYDINSKSQTLKETTTTAAKSAAEVSTSTPTTAQTQTSSFTEKRTGSPTTDLASSRNPVIIDNKSSSPTNEALGIMREAEDKARREAEAIEQTTIKESIEPQQRQQTIRQEKNLIRSKENTDYLGNIFIFFIILKFLSLRCNSNSHWQSRFKYIRTYFAIPSIFFVVIAVVVL